MYKKSRYLIEQPLGNESVLLFSSRSGELLELPQRTYDLVLLGAWNEIEANTLKRCLDAKFLVPDDENERALVLDKLKNGQQDTNYLHFDISPSSNCQMGCDYCGQCHVNENMSEKLEMEVFVRMKQKVFALNPKHLDFTWFGAEPLINFEIVKWFGEDFQNFCKENRIHFSSSIITNGLLLFKQTYLDLIESGVSDIQITLDGDRDAHDASRFLKTGKGTFDRIYKNIKDICLSDVYDKHKCCITIRCNIDQRNYQDIYKLIDMLEQDGLHNQILFYPTYVHSWENDVSAIEMERSTYAVQEAEMFTELLERGFDITPFLLPLPLTRSTCMATSMHDELYSANGNVFNCTEMLLTKNAAKNTLGNLNVSKEVVEGKSRPFSDWYEVIEKEEVSPCYSCELLPACGGHCPKHWTEGIAACPSFKFNIKERMLLHYASKQTDKANSL